MPTIKELDIIADLGQVDLTALIAPLSLSATIDTLNLVAIVSPSYLIGVYNPYTGKDRYRTIQTNIDAFDFTKFLASYSKVNNYVVPVADAKALSLASLMMAIAQSTANLSLSIVASGPTLSMDSVMPAITVGTVIS